jgi:hypothetical protein
MADYFSWHAAFGPTRKLCSPGRHWSMEPDAHCQGLPENLGLSSELDTVLALEYILRTG